MLQVRQSRVTCEGVAFTRTQLHDGVSREWPYVEIEPVDDSLPVLITRIGVRTYRLEYWYKSSCNDAQFVTYNVRSEERAMQLAASRVRKLGGA
jgi:hypothetical protein